MDSEAGSINVEDSDDSLLDIKELNDAEFDLPFVVPPSLESILWDMESEEGSDNTSLHSLQSLTTKFQSMLYHCILQCISSQITSAGERVGAGLPTVITNSPKYVSVGTSHGYVLSFDSEQKLCWCSHDVVSSDQGAISAMSFNMDSTRLLVGFERGYILMVDAANGDVVRRLPDAHAPQTAVLQLRFTAFNNLGLVGDSSGCVFSLTFSRRLGVRTWESKCLFSGARGEVCCFEPLLHDQDLLGQNVIVALATLSKVIIISIKPRLKVLFNQQLPKYPASLPLLSWQLVLVGKNWQPVLAWGRGSELNYTRVIFTGLNRNKLKLSPLRTVNLLYSMIALHWIGSRHLGIIDTGENFRLVEVRTQKEVEMIEVANAGLVYNSAHFKALAVGGGVSEAFALAGERACYNSLSSRGDQLLILGTTAVHLVKLRTWHERLVYLSDQGRWTEALNLAAEEGSNREKSTEYILENYMGSLSKRYTDYDSLAAAVNCCVKLNKINILSNNLWDAISNDSRSQIIYFKLVSEHICNGNLTYLSPAITQLLVSYLVENDLNTLKQVLLSLELLCLDLHQVLNICKKYKLYDAWIHITTKTIGDYTSPLVEFLKDLKPEDHSLGNTMLVYISACLAGLGFPTGTIPRGNITRVKYEVLRCLEAQHSISAHDDEPAYPYLRKLLKHNIRETLNVIKLAFTENEFSGEMGLLQQQRLINILTQIVAPPDFNDMEIIILACFIAKLLAANNLKFDEKVCESVIKSLTECKSLSLREQLEREQAWLDLLQGDKIRNPDITHFLNIALQTKCFRVAEYLYEREKDYSKIMTCYLNDDLRKSDVYSYILLFINVPERCIKQQILEHFKLLVQLDVKKCVDIVIEHFYDLLEDLFHIVEDSDEILYQYLNELIINDVKLPVFFSEHYLELLCKKEINVRSFLDLGLCRVDKALEITKKYEVHSATALLLEKNGEYREALELLLEHNLTELALEVCIHGSDHLDSKESQSLWLLLLQKPNNSNCKSLRQLLHAAAPHVPPATLLELVSTVSFGDIKVILDGMITDCKYDVEMLTTTFRLLGSDLHLGLAKCLGSYRKGISVSKIFCQMCQTPLQRNYQSGENQGICVCGCGSYFHSKCGFSEDKICPFCKNVVTLHRKSDTTKLTKTSKNVKQVRPDLEGHF